MGALGAAAVLVTKGPLVPGRQTLAWRRGSCSSRCCFPARRKVRCVRSSVSFSSVFLAILLLQLRLLSLQFDTLTIDDEALLR